ncbi:Tetratricopeptide repeat-containing protein [Chitinophaga jiangningensis]|uniref:Tetratricopeptide repeat-containing protein n=1 Tax=Chitinophaga jiangningensis TaxID=1419482 RepID=A0A1M6VIN1_9BACT|nr:tetratricopeptide repeat protein [Chitinophaga jiangningensis]SHK81362.1 Tetratricopeptide repeat-containing protein [Chitinophaga jiangningensis]
MGVPAVWAQNQPRNQAQRPPQNKAQQSNPQGNTTQAKPLFKPKEAKVQDRRTPAEIMLEKKRWTLYRAFWQNLATRYNYYFHARTKLDRVVRSVNRQGQDNYNVLLPFYPFTAKNQNVSKGELDSVIEKASTGIQLHDPRGKWIPDCYVLMGRAYFYEGDFENANKTFQYTNLAFAPKNKKEYKTVVGATENDQISVSSKENTKGVLTPFRHKRARNDAFLWRARTLLELKDYDEVQALLNLLANDPKFPKRLEGSLAEVRAYSNYIQGRYHETISPLQTAIDKSHDKVAKARMSFILGQLYALESQPDSAIDQFKRVIHQKPDPMMDFQARVQIARLNAAREGGNPQQSIDALRHMLKKQKFEPYRDGILYTMGSISYPKDPEAALGYMQKSLKVPSENRVQRTITYKGIADIYYDQRNYAEAKKYYDSTAGTMTPEFVDFDLVNTRKNVLGDVAARVALIHREDSLQRIATMPESDRNIFLAKMAGTIRQEAADKKKNEKKDKGSNSDNYTASSTMQSNGPGAFSPQAEGNGDWYFYNVAAKSSGYSEFRRRWGNRQLADNWRRSQTGAANIAANNGGGGDMLNAPTAADAKPAVPADSMTADVLAAGLPLTPEKLRASRTKCQDAWFDLGKLYYDKLDNAPLAIETYDSLLLLYPDHPRKAEVLYSLYVWNGKQNRTDIASRYKNQVLNEYGQTNFADIIRFGGLKDIDAGKKKAISAAYDSAYTAFRNGNYADAIAMRAQVDTVYGLNYLQPKFDLLQAMIIVKTDSTFATDSVNRSESAVQYVMNKYAADSAIFTQAQSLMAALKQRKEIYNYLIALEVKKNSDGTPLVDEDVSMRYPWQNPQPVFTDKVNTAKAKADSIQVAAGLTGNKPAAISVIAPPKPVTPYKVDANNPFFVVLSFDRVSKDLMDEGLNQFARYNASKHATDKIEVGSFVLTPNDIMLIFRIFPNEDKALAYFDEIRDAASNNIIPRIRPTDYSFFVISRDNFILLNSTKDLAGYRKFFADNYVTE